jgi:imidazolonepropionase-like amidohydrolase
MRSRAALSFLLLVLSGCKPPEDSHSKAIIGAVLIDGNLGPPRSDSVVVVAEGEIRAAGPRSAVSFPSESSKINGGGRYVVPTPIDICDRSDPDGLVHAANPAQAREQVEQWASRKATAIHLGEGDQAILQAAAEAARSAGMRVIGHIATVAGARALVDAGATVLVGMFTDTDDPDARLLRNWRDLQIVVAPSLGKAGARLDIARRNTRRLFEAGVPLAVASQGGDAVHEIELLVEAGVPPLDAIVAATHNGAMALGELAQRGTIEPGRRADLLLLSANPGEDVRNLRRVDLKLAAGEVVR